MRKLNMNRVFKILIVLFFASTLLSACGGADVPYNLLLPNPSPEPSPSPQPPLPGGQCAVNLASPMVQLLGQGNSVAGRQPPGHDTVARDGQFSSNNVSLSDTPIPIRFNGTTVELKSIDFPVGANIMLGVSISVKIAEGGDGSGTYEPETGKVEIQGIRFQIQNELLGSAPLTFPAMTLTTESINIEGDFGAVSQTGQRINPSDKSIKMVGGFKIPADFASSVSSNNIDLLRNGALTLTFSGTLERVPDGSPCSGADAGVRMVELTGTGENIRETAVDANNTLSLGSVFVPQGGEDVVNPSDTRYTKVKRFRIKNGGAQAISGAFQNQQNFTFDPPGAFTIGPNQNKDFTVTYSVPPVTDYSLQNVPKKKDVNIGVTTGGVALNFKATAKRAAPEMVVVGTESNALSTVDLRTMAAKMLGRTDATSILRCDEESIISPLSAKVTVLNRGVRPLEIAKINRPTDAQAQAPDPGCINYGTEFLRMGLGLEGGTTCRRVTVNGRAYDTDTCTIPPNAESKINFKVVYLPVNASSVRNTQNGNPVKDSGSMTIESNDPAYESTQNKFTLQLSAGITADKSDVLSISKATGTGGSVTDSNRVIRPGGNVRLNIAEDNREVPQNFFLRNSSGENIRDVRITVVGEEANFFEVLNTPPLPTTVGPFTGEPGRALFAVKYIKRDGTGARATLRIQFKVGTSNTDNIYEIGLIGSVNRRVIRGRMRFNPISINAFINTTDVGSVDSEDARMERNNLIKSGPIDFDFSEDPENPNPNLRRVRLIPALEERNIIPSNDNLLEAIRSLNREQRKKLFRVYSTKFTRGYGNPDQRRDNRPDGDVVCDEPEILSANPPAGTCAYFNYIMAHGNGPGYYDDETGDMILNNLAIRLVIPNHVSVGTFPENVPSVMELPGSIGTLTMDARRVTNFLGTTEPLPLLAEATDRFDLPTVFPGSSQSLLQHPETRCPVENWTPLSLTDTSPLPRFGCFVTPTARPFLKGFSLQETEAGKYMGTLVLIVKFANATSTYDGGRPQNVPEFLANQVMWVAITGKFEAVTGTP